MTTRIVRHSGGWTNYVHLGASICASQSRDGNRIASSATHGQLLIREVSSGAILARLNGHWNSVGWIAWAPDDSTLASACSDGTARVWDPDSASQVWQADHPTTVTAVEYLGDGAQLLTGCWDGALRIWDIASRRKLHEVSLGGDPVGAIATAQGTDSILAAVDSALPDEPGRLVLLQEGHAVSEVALFLPESYRVRWAPDLRQVAITGRDSIEVYRVVGENLELLGRHSIPSTPLCVDWSPDAKRVSVGSKMGDLYFVDVLTEQAPLVVSAHKDLLWDVQWHRERDQLISVSADGSIAIWTPSGMQLQRSLGPFSRGVSAVDWSPDETVIVSSSAEGHFCLWDVLHRRAIGEFEAHRNWIRSIRWEESGDRFLTASQDGSIGVWNAEGVEIVPPLDLGIGGLWSAVWTRQGQIAAVSETGHLCILDPFAPASSRTVKVGSEWLRGLSWSPDGKAAAIGSSDGSVQLRTVAETSLLWEVKLEGACYDCSFSPDGTVVAVALGDGTVCLLDRTDGDVLSVLEGHDDQVWSVEFSADGTIIVSAGADGTVRLWDVASRSLAKTYSLATSCISPRFSHTGKVLFGSAGAWVLDPSTAKPVPGEYSKRLTDSPVALLDGPAVQDLLGRSPLVEELAFFLHRTSEHSRTLVEHGGDSDGFVIHIGGRWGSGKTTLANDLVDRVRLPEPTSSEAQNAAGSLRHWDAAFFQAWSAVGLGPAWWSIAMAVRSHLISHFGFVSRLRFRLAEINFQFPRLLRQLSLLAALLPLSVFAAIKIAKPWVVGAVQSVDTALSASPAPWAGGVSIVADFITVAVPTLAILALGRRLLDYARRRWRWPRKDASDLTLESELDFSALPREYLRWLRSRARSDLLLIIDDLDRCPPDFVAETLSAIRTMIKDGNRQSRGSRASRPHSEHSVLAVLVLAEREWLEAAVEDHLQVERRSSSRSGKSVGAEFLEKIFIASLDLPRLPSEQRQSLVRSSVSQESGKLDSSRASLRTGISHAGEPSEDSKLSPLASLEQTITSLQRPDTANVAGIRQRIASLDPENRERMHLLLAQRTNQPEYRSAEEVQILDDYASLMDNTPRGVKRTLVNFWLNRALSQLVASHEALSDEQVMRWTILTLRWPSLLRSFGSPNQAAWEESCRKALGDEHPEFVAVIDALNLERVYSLLRT